MNKEMLDIVNDLSKKPTTELALQVIELSSENLILEHKCKKQKEIINKIEEKIKENIKNAEYDIIALTITDREYYKYVDDMLNDLLQILENKEVSE